VAAVDSFNNETAARSATLLARRRVLAVGGPGVE
jgi:hypothetical protein